MKSPARWLLCVIIGSFNAVAVVSHSYELETHDAITARAVRTSAIDMILRNDIGISDGIEQASDGKTLAEWIRLGSIREDDLPRFLNHFHNPVRTWDAAGFRVPWPFLGVQLGFSSILWEQDTTRSGWSWWNARSFYLDALTRPQAAGRDERLARTFEALGHVVHLVQDAASPAHTRNDPHIGPGHEDTLAGQTKGFNYETFVREVAVADPAFLDTALTPRLVSAAWQTIETNPLAPVPVAALIDSDRYDGSNPAVTTEDPIGLAEYANANFLSEDRAFPGLNPFTRFAYPARTSATIASVPVTLPGGESVNRQYYVKTADGDTGHRLATVGFLRDYQVRFQLDAGRFDQKPALDEAVYRDSAGKLLPRAVGYSTALIDYFFRGRLDVGLVDEVDNPRVVGTNASHEPLDAGTLFVYAEDAAGTRTLVSNPQGVGLDTPVPPGAPLPDVPLTTAHSDARRFVAVYRGGLGNERPASAAPGAVIGKVFAPLRVEEIYRDGPSWMVRTPTAVITLPLTTAEFATVKWGDDPDTIVARTPDFPRVVVYDVSRPTAAGDIAVSGTPPVAVLTERLSVSLPFAEPPTVATVQWSDVVDYTQRFGRFTVTTTAVWHEPTETSTGFYTFDVDHQPIAFEVVQQQTVPFGGAFDVVLDAAHNGTFGSGGGHYRWFLGDVAADRHGRLLGLVVVHLTNPGVGPVQISVLGIDQAGVPTAFGETTTLAAGFPLEVAPLLWAIVDLAESRVIASSAETTITLGRTRAVEAPLRVFRHEILAVTGGPAQPFDRWDHVVPTPRESSTADVELATTVGDVSLSATGWMRGDLATALAAAGVDGFGVAPVVQRSYYNYDCPDSPCGPGDVGMASFGVVATLMAALAPPPQFFRGARATRPADGERIVLLGDTSRGADWPIGHLLVWDAEVRRAGVRLQLPPAFARTLGVAPTAQLAMLVNRESPFETGDTYLVRLDAPDAPALLFPKTDLTSSFRLLDPAYLYGVSDMKFYKQEAPLQATRLPTALQPVASHPIGNYHIVAPR